MIDTQHGRLVAECDICLEDTWASPGETNFKTQFWPRLRKAGWSCREVKGVYLHACDGCELPA